jgi:alpha-tubulin suppressor-like RCC1 family protein
MTFRTPLILALAVGAFALTSCNENLTAPPSATAEPALATATAALAFYQVSGGDSHTCGVTTDNRAYCWGDNLSGQLGDGTTNSAGRSRPAAVLGGLRFHQISAGTLTTCGVTLDYRVYCWGHNGYGQVGDGTNATRLTPVPVAGGRRFRQVDVDFYHACALSYPDPGRAYCWGSNFEGELGDGTRTNRSVPVAVLGNLVMRQVTAGAEFSCGVTPTNLAYCWGTNRRGQLGDSSTANWRSVPSRVAGAHQFRNLDAGDEHACAVTTGDRAYCWGNGRSGQIGNGKTYLSFWPRAVAGGLSFTRVSAGATHTCGETRANQAYCWGDNAEGQAGDGTTTQRLTPVLVTGGLTFKQVSAGGSHTCGKTDTSEAYCWGFNTSGQLGNGTTTSSSRPVPVAGPM